MNEEAARKLARYRVGEDQHMGKSKIGRAHV